jgi:hypothetical protein
MPNQRKAIFARRRGAQRHSGSGRTLEPVKIKRLTGFEPRSWPSSVPRLRAGRYLVDERPVGGDAPKDFIWIYRCQKGGVRLESWRTWPAYIAKVGHQFYPAESITEQLITRIGQICGLQIADSRLMLCAGQVRFLSRYFLRGGEILNHGAEILGGYLSDKEFVDGVAVERAEKDLFTFQVFCTALKVRFPGSDNDIIRGFVRMIGFDALIGNQDRHFYNWGVITHPTGASAPRFAPIYDTARGLFWNTPESGLGKYFQDQSLIPYIRRAKPQIGWDGWDSNGGEISHFDLVGSVAAHDMRYWRWLEELGKSAWNSLAACEGMIDAEFGDLLSEDRRELIKRCLRIRFDEFTKIF